MLKELESPIIVAFPSPKKKSEIKAVEKGITIPCPIPIRILVNRRIWMLLAKPPDTPATVKIARPDSSTFFSGRTW
jgi:hypothetical protein